MLRDIAAVTGATVITEELGIKLESATPDMLGQAEKSFHPRTRLPSCEAKEMPNKSMLVSKQSKYR